MLEHAEKLLKAANDTHDLAEMIAYIKAAAILIDVLEIKKKKQR